MEGRSVYVREAVEPDARRIAENLRESDKEEIWLACAGNPEKEVMRTFKISEMAWIVYFEEHPVCLGGCCDGGTDGPWKKGYPWFVATDELNLWIVRMFLAKYSPNFVFHMFEKFDYLENWVYHENLISLSWLARLLFTIDDEAPYGPFGAGFHHVSLHRMTMERLLNQDIVQENWIEGLVV